VKRIVLKRSDIPIYEQIKENVKDAIFSGELAEDEQLPSIRQLAHDLKISLVTATRAYNDLEMIRYPIGRRIPSFCPNLYTVMRKSGVDNCADKI